MSLCAVTMHNSISSDIPSAFANCYRLVALPILLTSPDEMQVWEPEQGGQGLGYARMIQTSFPALSYPIPGSDKQYLLVQDATFCVGNQHNWL